MTALTIDTLAPELTAPGPLRPVRRAGVREGDAGRRLDLLFCGHHFRAHEAKLVAAGATVQDERDRIDQAS